jgi:O-6-methylguanine DNA methyltransferase
MANHVGDHRDQYREFPEPVLPARAVRAVGDACSNNPLELAIPCHRVLRSDGSVSGGSAWGDRRQRTLITREANAIGKKS